MVSLANNDFCTYDTMFFFQRSEESPIAGLLGCIDTSKVVPTAPENGISVDVEGDPCAIGDQASYRSRRLRSFDKFLLHLRTTRHRPGGWTGDSDLLIRPILLVVGVGDSSSAASRERWSRLDFVVVHLLEVRGYANVMTAPKTLGVGCDLSRARPEREAFHMSSPVEELDRHHTVLRIDGTRKAGRVDLMKHYNVDQNRITSQVTPEYGRRNVLIRLLSYVLAILLRPGRRFTLKVATRPSPAGPNPAKTIKSSAVSHTEDDHCHHLHIVVPSTTADSMKDDVVRGMSSQQISYR